MNCVDAGNVLVHLFLQTKTKYVLTNRKLQYLLMIAQMARLAQGQVLFEDDIRNFKRGFVLDVIGDTFMSGTEIVSGSANDMSLNYSPSDFVLPYTKKKIYEIEEMPTDEERDLLIKVFLAFGAYNENTLCQLLNKFTAFRRTTFFKAVEKEFIRTTLIEMADKGSFANNVLFDFIKEQRTATLCPAEAEAQEAHEPVPEVTPALVVSKTQEAPEAVPATIPAPVEPEVQEAHELIPESTPAPAASAVEEACSEQKEVPEAAPAAVTPPPVPVVPFRPTLRKVRSLNNIVIGKQYSILVEVPSVDYECHIVVSTVGSGRELATVRSKLSDTMYCFSFVGVAENVKISPHITKSTDSTGR